MQIQGIVNRAITAYRRHSFWGFVKAGSIYALERCRSFPPVGIVVRRARFRRLVREEPLRLNLGCGRVHLPGYVNIDKYRSSADLVMDVVKLPFPSNSVDEIFSSHMVEHMTYTEFVKGVKEWKRVLRKAGLLIIRCPNFEKRLRDWLNADYQERWGENNYGVNEILGFQDRGPGHMNRNVFTSERLANLVSKAGFEVLECHPHMSRDGETPDDDILLRARKHEK